MREREDKRHVREREREGREKASKLEIHIMIKRERNKKLVG